MDATRIAFMFNILPPIEIDYADPTPEMALIVQLYDQMVEDLAAFRYWCLRIFQRCELLDRYHVPLLVFRPFTTRLMFPIRNLHNFAMDVLEHNFNDINNLHTLSDERIHEIYEVVQLVHDRFYESYNEVSLYDTITRVLVGVAEIIRANPTMERALWLPQNIACLASDQTDEDIEIARQWLESFTENLLVDTVVVVGELMSEADLLTDETARNEQTHVLNIAQIELHRFAYRFLRLSTRLRAEPAVVPISDKLLDLKHVVTILGNIYEIRGTILRVKQTIDTLRRTQSSGYEPELEGAVGGAKLEELGAVGGTPYEPSFREQEIDRISDQQRRRLIREEQEREQFMQRSTRNRTTERVTEEDDTDSEWGYIPEAFEYASDLEEAVRSFEPEEQGAAASRESIVPLPVSVKRKRTHQKRSKKRSKKRKQPKVASKTVKVAPTPPTPPTPSTRNVESEWFADELQWLADEGQGEWQTDHGWRARRATSRMRRQQNE